MKSKEEIEQYANQLCPNNEHQLKRFVKHSVINAREKDLDEIRNKQVLYVSNHRSHFDYLQQCYNIWSLNLPWPSTLARANVFIPYFGKVWENCGAIKIPFNAKGGRELKYLKKIIRHTVKEGKSILDYAPSGRDYGDIYKLFDRGAVDFTLQAARELDLEVMLMPMYINYSNSQALEHPFFPTLNRVKGKHRNIPYVVADLAAFVSALFYPKQLVFHAFGEPFSLIECKTGKEAAQKAYESVMQLHKKFSDKISNWPGR